MIRYLPKPFYPRKGGNFLSTIGRHSRPIIKRILRTGKNALIRHLTRKATDKINKGGELLTALAPVAQRGGRVRGASYKVGKKSLPIIPQNKPTKTSHLKKRKLKGGKREQKKKTKKKKKGGKKIGGRKKGGKGGKKGGKNGGKKGGKKPKIPQSVFDFL